jgi:hypothetical protein
VLDAETERRKSALALLRVTGMLEEAPDILALDRAHRIAERAERYAAIESKYGKIVDDRDELGHQRNITKLRREREIQEANARLVDAKRDRFTAEQKLENEQRLRQFDLESLQKRTETQHLEKVPALEPRHDAPTDAVGTHSSIGSLAELRGMRESLLKQARERAAEGDGDQAKEYEKLIAELDEFVIAVSRGQGQK